MQTHRQGSHKDRANNTPNKVFILLQIMHKEYKYMGILYTLQTQKYREKDKLMKMIWSKWVEKASTRYGMIKRLEDCWILVKQDNVYQVVEHKEYKKL
jgi:hypothetical protein